MRSDREELPEGYTKEDADKAEIAEAKILAAAKSRNARSSTTATNAIAAAAPTDCMIYFPEVRYQVCGLIRVKYDSLGGPNSFLKLPISNELTNPNNTGKRSEFMFGPIYWSASTGAHPVVNSFMTKWGSHGWESGFIGYPTTDEIVNPDGIGRRQEFQNAAIYWHPTAIPLAAVIGGAIRDKWNTVNAERPGSLLGYPTTDEIVLPGGQGRMNRFERGVIYWSPTGGAHPITGFFLLEYELTGYEAGTYGYPLSDEVVNPGTGRYQLFERKRLNRFLPTDVDGSYGYNFHPAAPNFEDTDEVGHFTGQVTYAQPPNNYPMSWSMQHSEFVYAVAQSGPATIAKCRALQFENGKRTNYNWDHYSPGKEEPIGYLMHSTVPSHKVGAQEELYGWCTFPDKSGETWVSSWYFDYTVLDFN